MTPGPAGPSPPCRPMPGKFLREYGEWVQVALMFPSSIAVGLALGYGLDRWWKTAPVFTLVLALLGIVAGFYNFYKTYTRWERRRSSGPPGRSRG